MVSFQRHIVRLGVVFVLGVARVQSAVLQLRDCHNSIPAMEGDTCEQISTDWSIPMEDFLALNAGTVCPDLVAGRIYCVQGDRPVPTSTVKPPSSTTVPANGIQTPQPTLQGMVSNCNKFHLVKTTTTCQGIVDYNKIARSDLVTWNPILATNCDSALTLGSYACAGVIGGSTAPPPTTTVPSTIPGNGVSTPTPIQSGMTKDCNKFHLVKSTTTCQGILDYNKIDLANFIKWNPAVKSDCTNLHLGTYACVGVIGGSPAPTSTTPSNGVKTPTPTQSGMVQNCNKFHEIKSTTTCQGVLDYNKISLANFIKWNPAVGSNCQNLWKGTYACVGIIGGTPTEPSNPTPTPTQAGMIKGCTKWHFIKDTTTCQGVLDYNKISLSNFIKWNPAVGSNCQNLWKGTHACVKGP